MKLDLPSLRPSRIGLIRNVDTWITGALLLVVTLAAWISVVQQAATMTSTAPASSAMGMGSDISRSTLSNAAVYLSAWGIMMAAMMLPSAWPMILFYSQLRKNAAHSQQRGIPVLAFAVVYLAAWVVFGLPIYVASLAVDQILHANPVLAAWVPYGIGLILICAGVYQLTPLKRACLRACQSPLGFLMGHWQSGYLGTLRLALDHALACIGCCWALMVVLVAAGAMALHWVLLIAAAVFVEKLVPAGAWTARILGAALIALGLLVLAQPSFVSLLQGMAPM